MGAHGARGDLEERGGRTLLLVDQRLDIEIDADDDQVADDIDCADRGEHSRIVERYLLGHLHHAQDDDNICPGQAAALARRRYSTTLDDDTRREGWRTGKTDTRGLRPAIMVVDCSK